LNGGNISLAADRMSLQGAPASIQAGPGQAISVQPKTTGWNIGLGGAASDLAANTLELSASELATLSTTGSLRIGSTFAGPGSVVSGILFISGPIASAAGTLVLGSGGDIAQGSLGVVTADKLGLQALGNIDLSLASNQVANLAGHAGNGGTHSFKFVNGPDLHITNGLDANTDGLFGINGISVNFGPIALKSGGALTQSATGTLGGQSVYAEGKSVVLTAPNPTGVIAGKATGSAPGDVFNYTSSAGIAVDTVPSISGTFSGVVASAATDPMAIQLTGTTINQNAGAPIIATTGLQLATPGPVNLADLGNNVGALATAGATGPLNFFNTGPLTIGGSGVSSTGSVKIDSLALTVNANVVAIGPLKLIADSMQIGASVSSGNLVDPVVFAPRTPSRPIIVGGVDDPTKFSLTQAELDNVGTAAAIAVGGPLHTGGLDVAGNIASTLPLRLLTGGTLSLHGTVSSSSGLTTGAAVVLSGGTNFINSAGVAAVSTPGGRWVIYSADPVADTFGGLISGNPAVWGAGFDPSLPNPLSGLPGGDRYVFASHPAVSVTANPLL